MTKNVVICTLLLICVWFGKRIVVLENYHLASQLNMCSEHLPDLVKREKCLNEVEVNTHWVWDLAYGLEIL